MTRTHLVAMAVSMLVLTSASSLHAQSEDYRSGSTEWNGLRALLDAAREADLLVETPTYLDVGTLRPNDAVIVVHPRGELPVASLAAFMREGGRLALADDFGGGDDLLRVYSIGRAEASVESAPHLRGNRNLPVAAPAVRHALTEGVTALVANHPTELFHEELEPLFAFGDSGRGLVLAGAVGEGRMVAIGDPSLFINNMMEFRDNRRFAENLLRYLHADDGGRVFIVVGNAELAGRYGEPGADRPFHDLRSWLEELAAADAPPLALLLGAVVIASILLVVAATSLPRRSPYDGSAMFARPALAGGFVGRVGFFKRPASSLLQPLMVYKFELEEEIIRRLHLQGRALLKDVVEGLRRHGLTETEIAEARTLLLELDELRRRQDQPPGPPRVTAARFRSMIAAGQRLLARLEREGKASEG